MKIVDSVWNDIFKDYPVLENIEKNGVFEISSGQIKKYYEPRLVTKFDFSASLPDIMKTNGISILPNTTGTYVLGKFHIFQDFPMESNKITTVPFPEWIESIDPKNIPSESVAIAAATITPMFADFFDDDKFVSTVSGRMGSGKFDFIIGNQKICVNSSQIEIDGALESPNQFVLLEGKNILHDDFIVRQLYYPYRTFEKKIKKPIKTVFITYSNHVYRLMEYQFLDSNHYDSIAFVREKKYCIEESKITLKDIGEVFSTTKINDDTYGAPFIQCDSFSKIINILEKLKDHESMTEDDIVDLFGFTKRQGNYYYNGCRYLGFVTKDNTGNISLTPRGSELVNLPYKERQLKTVGYILEHRLFHDLMESYLKTNSIPERNYIKRTMKLYQVCKDGLIDRRSASVASWFSWILSLME